MSDDKLKPPKYQMSKFDIVMVTIITLGLMAFLAYVFGGM